MVMSMKPMFAKISKLASVIVLLSSFIAGCGAPTPTATAFPTIDQTTLVAAAVKTISAQMTEEALRNPSPTPTSTPVPPTDTPLPPTETATPAVPPTATATEAPALSAKFLYAATFPENKRDYIPNEIFGLEFGFQNTGTITWVPGYQLKVVSYTGDGEVQPSIDLGKAVEPGNKAIFDLWAFGSETLGDHKWVFQLYTDSGIPVSGGVAYFTYKSH
jgi:hypothetical protein